MATLNDFMEAVRIEALSVSRQDIYEPKLPALDEIFIDCIDIAMEEIKNGADSDDFRDLVVANFLVASASLGVESDQIIQFLKSLNDSDSFKDSAAQSETPVNSFSQGLPPLESFKEFYLFE